MKHHFTDLFTLTAVAAETTPSIAEPSIVVSRVHRGDSGTLPDALGAPITRWYGSVDFSASGESEIVVLVRDGAKEIGEVRFLVRDFLAFSTTVRTTGGADAFRSGFKSREKKVALVHGASQVRIFVSLFRLLSFIVCAFARSFPCAHTIYSALACFLNCVGKRRISRRAH